MFKTSAVTIRRDLQVLEEMGLIKRVHGGAISHQALYSGIEFSEKEKIRIKEKERIASYAANLVKRGDVIIIDSGSTCLKFAQNIKGLRDITVICNSLKVATELSKSDMKIIVTGGEMDKDSFTLYGPLANTTLANISADKLFMGIDSIDLKVGLTTPNIYEARTCHDMMELTHEKILLADSSKFGRRSLAVVSKVDSLDKIITDSGLKEEEREKYRAMGIEVIIV